MVICAILNCHNRSDRSRNEGISFYRLPSIICHQGPRAQELSTTRQLEWLAKIQRKDITPDRYCHIRVCSKHFLSGSPANLFDNVNPDWVPSVNLGYGSEGELGRSSGRFTRAIQRTSRKRNQQEEGSSKKKKILRYYQR